MAVTLKMCLVSADQKMEEEKPPVYQSLIEKPPPAEKRLPGARLAATALLIGMSGPFHFGYQLAITNPSQEAFLQFVNSSYSKDNEETVDRKTLENIWGVLISLFFWGMTVGAFLIRWISHKIGRKNGIQLALLGQILCLLMAIFSYFRNDYILYGISRFLLGLTISIALGIAPILITECSPKSCRGVTSMASGVMIQSALTLGAVVAMPRLFGSVDRWWLLYAGELGVCIVVSVLLFFIHDSPGHLIVQGRRLKAQNSLIFYYGNCNISGILANLEEERQNSAKTLSLTTIWKDPVARRGTLIGGVVMVAMVMSGIAAINAFAFEILLSVGLNVLQASIGNVVICLMTVLGIFCSSMIIDHFGRRPLLLYTFTIITVVNFFVVALMLLFQSTKEKWLGFLLLFAIAIFNFVFASGPGPVSLFITSELVGHYARGAACTWVSIFMCTSRSLLLLTYLPIKHAIGQSLAFLFLFVPPLVVGVILIYYYLPETKGRSPQEVKEAAETLPRLKKKGLPNLLQ